MPQFQVNAVADCDAVHFEVVEYGDGDEGIVRRRTIWSAAHAGPADRLQLVLFGEALAAVAAGLPAAIARGLTGPRFIEVLADLTSFVLESELAPGARAGMGAIAAPRPADADSCRPSRGGVD